MPSKLRKGCTPAAGADLGPGSDAALAKLVYGEQLRRQAVGDNDLLHLLRDPIDLAGEDLAVGLARDAAPADVPLGVDADIDVGLGDPLASWRSSLTKLRATRLDIEHQPGSDRPRLFEIDRDHVVVLARAVEPVRPAAGRGENGDEVERSDNGAVAELDVGRRLSRELLRRRPRASCDRERWRPSAALRRRRRCGSPGKRA